MNTLTLDTPVAGKPIRFGLWTAQLLMALLYVYSGVMKFSTPIPQLAQMMPWTGDVPETFVRAIGAVDFAAGVGLVLPALTRILPGLTPLAAAGSTLLQVLAFGFHTSRGEYAVLLLNVILLALSVFVLWGRTKKAPILPR
jgi:uncharacterized membrane protein YphA (DoxX/SURF4 family)